MAPYGFRMAPVVRYQNKSLPEDDLLFTSTLLFKIAKAPVVHISRLVDSRRCVAMHAARYSFVNLILTKGIQRENEKYNC